MDKRMMRVSGVAGRLGLTAFLVAAVLLSACEAGSPPRASMMLVADSGSVEPGARLTIGRVEAGQRGAETILGIINTGTVDLVLDDASPVRLSGSDAAEFEITSLPATVVPPGATREFRICFHPAQAGEKSATLTVASRELAYAILLDATANAPSPGDAAPVAAPEPSPPPAEPVPPPAEPVPPPAEPPPAPAPEDPLSAAVLEVSLDGAAYPAGGTAVLSTKDPQAILTLVIRNSGNLALVIDALTLSGEGGRFLILREAAGGAVLVLPASFTIEPGGTLVLGLSPDPDGAPARATAAALGIAWHDSSRGPADYGLALAIRHGWGKGGK